MVRPNRSEQHPNLRDAIVETAWQQIARKGAAALSLRGIARELEITAPAIYNYFPRRDDLVTALIAAAFQSLGDSQKAALEGIKDTDHRSRFRALGMAYRDWALRHPERYQLIFGTPIAGYEAPVETTMPAAAGSLQVLIDVLHAAWQAGVMVPPADVPMPPALKGMLSNWQSERGDQPAEVLYLALSIWTRVHGLVSIEIGEQYPPYLTDAASLYRREIDLMIHAHLK